MLMRMSWPGMAYGAAASWQSTPVDPVRFFPDYARCLYSSQVASEVASALEKLAKSETTLQKVLGQPTMIALWDDPFTASYLKRLAEHRQELRQTRLLAEEAQAHLYRALTLGGDTTTLNSFLLGSRLLDYAGLKFLTAIEVADRWQQIGPLRSKDQLWNQLGSEMFYQSHGRPVDLMDAITELREKYRSAWLSEYTPYRLASALGRYDAEYEYWRRLQAQFRRLSDSLKDGEALPPLESVTRGQ